MGLPLRSGQLVLSEAPGAYSFLFALGPERHFDFTHAAVLAMEDGQAFVYEMTGEYKLGFEERVTDGVEGFCRRLPLADYCAANLYVEIFDPPEGVDGEQVAAWAQARYREQPPFDAYFDYTEHERLFCTEFVALALEAGGAPPVELVPVRQQPSLQQLLEWFGVKRDVCLPAGLLADPERRVAALGLLPTPTAARCYFAAKEELHRRFTDDQRMGNVFEMQGFADIALRPEVFQFLNRAVNLFPGDRRPPSRERVNAAVRRLSAELFGEGPPLEVGAAVPTEAR